MNTLKELLLNRKAELDLSFRGLAARSAGLVSHSTLHEIANDKHSMVFNPETLQGIALSIGVSQEAVRDAAGYARDVPTKFRLSPRADKLTDPERRAVESLVTALLTLHKERE